MKYLVAVFAILLAANTFVGCGKKKAGSAVAPAPAPLPNQVPNNCNPGQVFNTTYGCLDRIGCPEGQGWVPTIQRCEGGQLITFDQIYGGAVARRWGYPLQQINRNTFEQLMRDYGGFCGQYTWNFGSYDCKTYSNAGYVIIQTASSGGAELNMTIGAGTSTPYSVYDYWTAYNGGNQHFQMQFRAQVYPINNSQGFEFRSNGLAGTRSWNAVYDQSIRGVVNTGSLSSSSFTVELYYKGQLFGRAPVELY